MLFKVKYFNLIKEEIDDFFINGCCFFCAQERSIDHLNESVGEESWEFLRIKNVPNYVEGMEDDDEVENNGENTEYMGKCSNPFTTYSHSAPELQMDFACPNCKEVLHVSLNAWDSVFCPKCKTKIDRTEVTKNDEGKWVYKKMVIKNK